MDSHSYISVHEDRGLGKFSRHEKRRLKNTHERKIKNRNDAKEEIEYQARRKHIQHSVDFIESLRLTHEKNMIGLNLRERIAERSRYRDELLNYRMTINGIDDEINHIEYQSWGDELDMYDSLSYGIRY